MISFGDRIKMFDPKYQQNKDTTKKQNIPSKLKSNLFNQDYMASNKLIPKSKLISEKNGLFIYRYPLINFSDTDNISVKNILLLGNNQKPFINNFINYISNVLYDDKFRYESQSLNDDNFKPFSIYNIKADKCFRIISFPEFNSKNNIFKSQEVFISLIKIIKKITSKIDYIFFIYDDKMIKLNKFEKISLYILFNLFDLKGNNEFIFLYNSQSNEIKKTIINCILDENNEDEKIFNQKFAFLKYCEFIKMNNKIIYEKNKNTKNEWDILMNNNNKIEQVIKCSSRYIVPENKRLLMDGIFFFDMTKTKTVIQELAKYTKEEQIYLAYCLINIKKILKSDISLILLGMYNTFFNYYHKINFKTTDDTLSFIDIKSINKTIIEVLNFNFTNLQNIIFRNCGIDSGYFNLLGRIFTNKLMILDLSQNKISEINIFNNKEYPKLIKINLSSNNISDISPLFNSKIKNLKNLNLSHNNINILKIYNKNVFEFIEYLDLSYNQISDINPLEKLKTENILEINLSFNKIKDCNILSSLSLEKKKKLDLSNNVIEKMDINRLLEKFKNNCTNLRIEMKKEYLNNNLNKDIYNILFKYYSQKIVEFNYIIPYEKINDFFKNLSFKYIETLTLEGIFYLDLLKNETLTELIVLDIKKSYIEDLSIFDKVHFVNVKKVKLESNKIRKGFDYLKNFKSIKTNEIKINKNDSNFYDCVIDLLNPKMNLNIIFNDLEFLKSDIINGIEKLTISNFIIEDLEYINSPNFKNLKLIDLENNNINNAKVFSILNSFLKKNNTILSSGNKYKPNLFKDLNEDYFEVESVINSSTNKVIIKYIYPFEFTFETDIF